MSNPTELPDLVNKIADLFHIGALARDESTILTNLRNTIRRADCLSAVEREFFMVPGELDEDYPDQKPDDECLLSWSQSPAQYVEQFRTALVRRAQPEGEAPQATGYEAGMRRALHICRKIKDSKREHVAKVALIEACEAFAFELLHPAATLSPLCGAQHAESGKEVDAVADFDAWMAKRGPLGAGGHPSRAFIAGHAYGVRAAQQAAAPVNSPEIPDSSTSAPGTPEAPADLPRLYRFDCYVGKTKMAAGVGVHASTMEEAEQKARKLIDKEETIKFESNQPCHPTRKCIICAEYERAAQLDGGQEGSGHASS